MVTNDEGVVHQFFLTNAWGEELHTYNNANTSSFNSEHRFNDDGVRSAASIERCARSAELDEETGLAYYGARYYDNKISMWLSVDPLAMEGKNMTMSPYQFTENNPVMLVDPTGTVAGDFYDSRGDYLGSDGIDDGKKYILHTREEDFDGVAGANNENYRDTRRFIKRNDGNSQAFKDNDIAYKNSVEVIGSEETRTAMVGVASQDDGSGGSADANNREYGGVVRSGEVIESPAGDVANPKTSSHASITHPDVREGDITFHTHPSGYIIERPESNGWHSGTTLGGATTTYSFSQAPSAHDVNSAGNSVRYVFGMDSKTVYIYNQNGVLATFPMKDFAKMEK